MYLASPDFIGVGAQRCGTSWWFDNIARHPQVRSWPTAEHELHYFDRFWKRDLTPDDIAAYSRYFPRFDGEITGEWTPRYMYDPWTPPLLARAAPEAKLLVLLRDPVKRLLSGLSHAAAMSMALDESTVTDAFQRGLYGRQLGWMFEHVDKERVLVLQLERCLADPIGQLQRTYAFLGLDAERAPTDVITRKVNRSYQPRPPLAHVTMDVLRAEYRADGADLVRFVPEVDLSLWKSLA